MTKRSIAELWQEIHRYAEQQDLEILRNLKAPASEQDLAPLLALGLPLPANFLDSLRIHNGEAGVSESSLFNGGVELMSAEEILSQRAMLESSFEDSDAQDDEDESSMCVGIGPVRTLSYSPSWLPIMVCNGDVYWYLDFDPLPGGNVGQVIRVDLEAGEWLVCASSYRAFLSAYLKELKSGRRSESLWPPIRKLPWLRADRLDAGRLQHLARAGHARLALKLAAQVPGLPEAELLRLQSQAHVQAGAPKKALKALDALRALGAERLDDLLLRLDLLEDNRKNSELQVELDAAIARSPSAALLVRRAELHRELAAEPPFKASHGKAMRWLAGPAGQQHAAVSLQRAISDYRAALALEDRLGWRVDEAECLLEMQSWEDAEQAFLRLIERIEALPKLSRHDSQHLDSAREGLQRAQAKDAGEAESLMDTMDDLLSQLQSTLRGTFPKAGKQMREVRDTMAELIAAEAIEQRARVAAPERLLTDAKQVAEQIFKLHADTPERFADFDAATLDQPSQRYYDRARDALYALGFVALGDVEPVRNTEISGNRVLMRLLRSADQQTIAAIWRLANAYTVVEAIELESLLEDGRVVTTVNTGAANPFASPPEILVQALPQGSKAALLCATHARNLAELAVATQPIPDRAAVLALQEKLRLLKRDYRQKNGWVSDSELRGMLGASFPELAPLVREQLQEMLGG